jgi:hypothetical protein
MWQFHTAAAAGDLAALSRYLSNSCIWQGPGTNITPQLLKLWMAGRYAVKVHRVIGEGKLMFVQCTGLVNGEAYVFYDIAVVENGTITAFKSVEMKVPAVMMHTNGIV